MSQDNSVQPATTQEVPNTNSNQSQQTTVQAVIPQRITDHSVTMQVRNGAHGLTSKAQTPPPDKAE